MTLTRQMLAGSAAFALIAGVSGAFAQDLTIESWRVEDAGMWRDQIIPAFEAAHPGIKVSFAPTAPDEYDAALIGRLKGGTAGDLISCRPFDGSLQLFEKGYLAPLNALSGVETLPPLAKVAWSTDDEATTFCVPMATAILGFIYNKDAFEALGLEPPRTVGEFHQVLDALAADGRYTPLALGTNDLWEAATVGYQNIGPTYWKGEEGRLGLIAGTQKLSDETWIAPYRELASWRRYLGSGFEAQSYSDSQNLFTLGRAAIYPAGSWEIPGFTANAPFAMGAFPPPVVNTGDTCTITEPPQIGIGLNAKSANPDAAKAFLSFVASQQFGRIEANGLPGIYSPFSETTMIEDPLAREFASWRDRCETTIPSTSGVLSRGTPNLEAETFKAAVQVIRGAETPESVAARLQAGLDSWYTPPE